MRHWTPTFTSLLVLLLFDVSCASSQLIEPRQINQTEGAKRVLIATRPSDFKKQITDRLIENYQHHHSLRIAEITELTDIQPDNYDAMVVMGARMGFLMFSARERRFLRHLPNKERLILVMTAASSDWEWDRDDVDVITCASTEANVDPIYNEVSKRLDTLLAAER